MQWRDRVLREFAKTEHHAFLTLTFSEPHLMAVQAEAVLMDRTLERAAYAHVQRYLKRLRKGRSEKQRAKALSGATSAQLKWMGRRVTFPPQKFRYLFVFEEGEKNGRAHYHALIHAAEPIRRGVFETEWRSRASAELIRSEEGTASYVTKYLTKSLAVARASLAYGQPSSSLLVKPFTAGGAGAASAPPRHPPQQVN